MLGATSIQVDEYRERETALAIACIEQQMLNALALLKQRVHWAQRYTRKVECYITFH